MLRRSCAILLLVLRLIRFLAIRLGHHMDDASMAMAATIKFLFIPPDSVTSAVIAISISWSLRTKYRVMKTKMFFWCGGSFGGGGILQSDLLRRFASKFG
jgi:hypothetical protein